MMMESTNHVEQQIDSAVERQRQLRRLTHEIENGLPVFDFTDAERERITCCLPSRSAQGRLRRHSLRAVLDAL
jgi:hypothetical protein